MDKLIDEISKNPLQVQTTEGVEALENRVKQFVNFSDKDLEQVYWDRFYEVVEEAQNYKPTNNTVIENLKQQLEIAKGELNQAPEYSSKILIRINKNADNPYAILRSELEYARDIARGEVPDQSVKHFNRYEGMNESEMSLSYVKKKADSRANKAINGAKNSLYSYHTISEKIHGEPVRVKQIKNQNGNVLAEIRYTERGNDFEIRMDNLGIEKGAARKALAHLMQEYPNKNFYWKAINEQSVKSYNHFIQEYPELADRIRFNNQTSYEVIDRGNKALYNSSNKGVIDETGSNSSQYGRRSETTLSEGNPKGAENGSNNIREDIQGISSPDRYRYEQSGRSELSNGEQHAINNTQSKQEYSKRGNTADSQKTITDTSAADTRPIEERAKLKTKKGLLWN